MKTRRSIVLSFSSDAFMRYLRLKKEFDLRDVQYNAKSDTVEITITGESLPQIAEGCEALRDAIRIDGRYIEW